MLIFFNNGYFSPNDYYKDDIDDNKFLLVNTNKNINSSQGQEFIKNQWKRKFGTSPQSVRCILSSNGSIEHAKYIKKIAKAIDLGKVTLKDVINMCAEYDGHWENKVPYVYGKIFYINIKENKNTIKDMRKNNDKILLESLIRKYGVSRLTNAINKINEGVYGPTGAEARKKLQSTQCVKYQAILDKFNEIGLKEFPKYFTKYDWTKTGTLYVRLPEVDDGLTRRLCRHLEYDDIFINFPGTTLYYVINRDDLFSFKVSYAGYGAGTKVTGESFDDTAIFGPKTAKFFYDVITTLNPNTKVKLSDLEAD